MERRGIGDARATTAPGGVRANCDSARVLFSVSSVNKAEKQTHALFLKGGGQRSERPGSATTHRKARVAERSAGTPPEPARPRSQRPDPEAHGPQTSFGLPARQDALPEGRLWVPNAETVSSFSHGLTCHCIDPVTLGLPPTSRLLLPVPEGSSDFH